MTAPDQPDIDQESQNPPEHARVWMARGARAAVSIPAFILTAAFVGYAGLARETGLTLCETLAMTGFVWALPSIVVLTGAISSGMGILPAGIAVALASVRLMPMTMALMPLVKVPGKTKTWQLLIASHFVAVTAWVFAMKHLPDMPREGRLPFFIGFGAAVTSFVFCMTGVSYLLVESMPGMVAGALFLLTPVYFLCSLWGLQGSMPTGRRWSQDCCSDRSSSPICLDWICFGPALWAARLPTSEPGSCAGGCRDGGTNSRWIGIRNLVATGDDHHRRLVCN